jgi:hypothetical protein
MAIETFKNHLIWKFLKESPASLSIGEEGWCAFRPFWELWPLPPCLLALGWEPQFLEGSKHRPFPSYTYIVDSLRSI